MPTKLPAAISRFTPCSTGRPEYANRAGTLITLATCACDAAAALRPVKHGFDRAAANDSLLQLRELLVIWIIGSTTREMCAEGVQDADLDGLRPPAPASARSGPRPLRQLRP